MQNYIETSVLINLPTINEMFFSKQKSKTLWIYIQLDAASRIYENCLYLMRCVFKGLRKKQFFSFFTNKKNFSFMCVWIFIDGIAFIILLCFIIMLVYWHYEMAGVDNFYLYNMDIIHI